MLSSGANRDRIEFLRMSFVQSKRALNIRQDDVLRGPLADVNEALDLARRLNSLLLRLRKTKLDGGVNGQ